MRMRAHFADGHACLAVGVAVSEIRAKLPFPVRGLDVDNDSAISRWRLSYVRPTPHRGLSPSDDNPPVPVSVTDEFHNVGKAK
jgi:hypothetical protein